MADRLRGLLLPSVSSMVRTFQVAIDRFFVVCLAFVPLDSRSTPEVRQPNTVFGLDLFTSLFIEVSPSRATSALPG